MPQSCVSLMRKNYTHRCILSCKNLSCAISTDAMEHFYLNTLFSNAAAASFLKQIDKTTSFRFPGIGYMLYYFHCMTHPSVRAQSLISKTTNPTPNRCQFPTVIILIFILIHAFRKFALKYLTSRSGKYANINISNRS